MMDLQNDEFPPLPSQMMRKCHSEDRQDKSNQNLAPRKPKAATIDDLPDELLLEILSYLPDIDTDKSKFKSLLCLSVTNKHLHHVVIERLFAKFRGSPSNTYKFLRTIVTSPHIARCVRNMHITFGYESFSRSPKHLASAQDKRIIKQSIRRLDIPDWKIRAAECNADGLSDADALHSVILMHTPNIESLTVQESFVGITSEPRWLEILRAASMGTKTNFIHPFEHLRSLRLRFRQLEMRHLAPLFRLQSLRHLNLDCFSDTDDLDESDDKTASVLRRLLPESCNNLEELHFESAIYSMQVLAVFLSSPRNLRTFRYDFEADTDVYMDDLSEIMREGNALDIVQMSTAIRAQKHSLQKVQVASKYMDPLSLSIQSSMSELEQLQSLRCPLRVITDDSANSSLVGTLATLPASIQSLDVYIDDDWDLGNCMSRLAQIAVNSQTSYPLLKSVNIFVARASDRSLDSLNDASMPAMNAFSAAGIQLNLDIEDRWDWRSHDSSSEEEVDLYSEEE